MLVSMVRTIQEGLSDGGHYRGSIDGARGPLTDAAVADALAARSSDLPHGWETWSAKRKAVAYLQLTCHDAGIDAGPIDGWIGPQTRYAHSALLAMEDPQAASPAWRDITPLDVNPHGWPSETSVDRVFGPHGTPDGRTPPLVHVDCPWTLRIAWNGNQTTSRIAIHERCAESLSRILQRAHAHYGTAQIQRLRLDQYGGSYNPRKMRGSDRWSMHAWAIAIDWDPDRNRLPWNHREALMARPEYEAWWRFWEEEGWVSLGRWRNFDWMHVQAAKL